MSPDTPHTARYMLSCDWGTTAFRLQLVERSVGEIIGGMTDSDGIRNIHRQWVDRADRNNRKEFFLSVLREKISALAERTGQHLDEIPVVVSGMASSNMGLRELPYAPLPLALDDPGLQIERFPPTGDFPHELYLISGLCSSDDVMRGEETQLVGLAAKYGLQNGVFILPGTHSKHIYVSDNVVTAFRTYLTGELFELLATHSTLADSISDPPDCSGSDGFHKGLEASLRENVLHALFKIRAGTILHGTAGGENYDYLSGLLIGAELAELRSGEPGQIILAGAHRLQRFYSAACDYLNLDYMNAVLTEEITALGHRLILDHIQNKNKST